MTIPRNMTSQEFSVLKLKAKDDISFSDENYQQKTMDMPRLLQFYTNACLNEKRAMYHYEEEKHRVFKKLYSHYKFDAPCQWTNQSEIKYQVEGDDDYLKVIRNLEFLKLKVEFIDSCVGNIKTMGFQMRQYHEIKLFKNGLIK